MTSSSVGRKSPCSIREIFDWVIPARRPASLPDRPVFSRSSRRGARSQSRPCGAPPIRSPGGGVAVAPVLPVGVPVLVEGDCRLPRCVTSSTVSGQHCGWQLFGADEPPRLVAHPDDGGVVHQPEVFIDQCRRPWPLSQVEDADLLTGGAVVGGAPLALLSRVRGEPRPHTQNTTVAQPSGGLRGLR